MAAEKPAIVFVPGLCSVASIVFKPLIQSLQSRGGFTHLTPVDLPSVDAINTKVSLKPSGLQVDTTAVQAAIKAHIDAGRDVVVVAHSYGGTPGLYGTVGLWKDAAAAAGKKGVVKAVLLAASLSLPGVSVAGDREVYRQSHPDEINDGTPQIEKIDGVSSLFNLTQASMS